MALSRIIINLWLLDTIIKVVHFLFSLYFAIFIVIMAHH